ncbi:L10-interacting MYB domain-containing protein [Quillaja saponaria]|uniref:L10-interacting MYB domain-containing protein n=1 Tax=Quillaja saponaria TaxID=32244 RepID=A0AAD7Q1F6_QUISA|nr:L10-interacting MYB domain-containing protein [Quillaja saponaria]
MRAQNSNERLRTIWTPEMDHYFIDLMLEHVGKGIRFDDHLFSKRAWKDMSSSFNEKFKFKYDKDVLKNRHKTLRNLYRAVKNLLVQTGFSWDEKRNMVIADNDVWEEYIKVHPDARSYRIKSIPYFSDLCMIYGHPTTEEKGEDGAIVAIHPNNVGEGSYEALHAKMVDEGYVVSTPEKVVTDFQHTLPGTTSGIRTRTNWQPPMDRYFIDLMMDHVQQGNRVDGVFSKQAWMEMSESFNAKFGFDYSVEILKNRYKTLRRQCNVIKCLLDADGFYWDETRQMVTAYDYVWQAYIKVHTESRQFMTRPSPATSLSAGGQVGDALELTQSIQKLKRQLENYFDSAHSKRSRNKDAGMESVLHEMAIVVSSLSERKKDDENTVSIETVIEAVQALPDMDEDLVLDACDFLEDDNKAKTFLALDVKLRKKWLRRKLRAEV